MATLATLPNEIILDILDYLRPVNEHEPLVGMNGIWKCLNKFRKTLQPTKEQARSNADKGAVEKDAEKEHTVIQTGLMAFRVTSKRYYQLFKSMVPRELNLIDRAPLVEGPSLQLLQLYPLSLQTVRLLVTEANAGNPLMLEGLIRCKNITSLALYYDRHDSDPIGILVDCILELFHSGSLKKLGIYSNDQLELWLPPYIRPSDRLDGPVKLLEAIARSPKASKTIIALDLAIGTIPYETYDLIRTSLLSLQSLTVRRAFRHHLPRMMDQPSAERWLDNPNLTRLQLLVCEIAYAPHIPLLVRRFPALQYLLVSTCGQWGDEKPSPPDPDRHSQSTSLSKVHKPLKEFHIEHMEWWEILPMGEIPVETVIITNTGGGHIVDAFKLDPNIFPSLQCLRLEAPIGKDFNYGADCGLGSFAYSRDMMASIRTFCSTREVELRQDALAIKPLPRHRSVTKADLEHEPPEAPIGPAK